MYWANHLATQMGKIGFKASALDPCVFYGRGMVVLSYVDDCLFFGPDAGEIDKVIQDLKKQGMGLTVETGSAYAFLGVDVEPNEDGGFKMSQTGLIKKILKTVDMQDSNSKATPAASVPLGTDANGEIFNENWSYPQVVGMLLFLSSNSRPDIHDRILTYGTLLDVLWQMYHPWITYGTVRRIV